MIALKEIDLEVNDGEFLCIVGATEAGKSSLINTIVGNLMYIPKSEIDVFGGLERVASQGELDTIKERLLNQNFEVGEKPIKITGSLSFVE